MWDTIGAAHQSPDLGAIVEPIVGRGGWSQGNNLVFVIDGVGERTAESYNGSSGEAARLHIEYTYVPNDPPAAEFASSTADLTATFTDASSDTDGTIVSWAWDFGDSGSSTLQNPGHTYGAGGTYSVELTVTDDRGGTDSTTHSVTVTDPPPPNDPPTAAFTSEVTNLAATFTDTSTDPDGTVVSWAWDFGDTATSSMQNPSHFYAAAGTYFVALTVTDDDGDTGTASSSVTITAPPLPTGGVYLSFKSTVMIGGVTAQDEDILHWDGATTYTLAFDGSDVGLTGFEIDGFDVVGSNQVLLSFTGSGTVPDIGSVADSDIVRFTGSLGAATSGTFEMYFDGSDVGAAHKNEDIDGLTLLDDGSLLISTTGNYDLAGLSGTDADVIRFTGTFGSSTSGSFSLYFDGSDVEMTNKKEDIDALASDGIDLHFSTLDTLNALGVTAADEDAVTFSGTFGSSTSGTFASYWDGSSHGTTNDLGGLDIVTDPPPPNDPPTAGFTFSTADLTATFTDALSDTDGSVVLWAWDFGDSNTSTVEDPGHTYTAAGTYTVSLLVTDDDGDTDSISQSVTVTEPLNDPPTAGFTFSTADLTATFTDALSDTDGSVVLWAWDFGDSNTSTVEDPGHTYTAAGTYTVSLLVTDDDGDTDSISQSVTVTEPLNDPPTAGFTFSTADLTATFTDALSDTDGSVVLWAWDFGDSNTSTVEDPGHTYTAAGTYTVSLLVTDDDGDTDSISQSVTVTEPLNDPPTAGFTFSTADLTATFTDALSDTDGSVVLWAWDFGDSNTSTVEDPGHTYTAAGTYTVSLLVTDDDGDTDSISQSVTVTEPLNDPPTAGFTFSTADLTATFTDALSDTDGSVVLWAWDFGDSNTSTVEDPGHTYTAAGTYTVSLLVTDDDGDTDSISQSVTVTDPPPLGDGMYFAFKAAVTLGGVTVTEQDILHWDGAATYTLAFDGSDVGLGSLKIDGLDVIGPGQVLLSFKDSGTLPDIGAIDDSDIVLFTGTLGPATSGTFSMYFDASDVGLDNKREDIDAFTLLADGSLLISTKGSFSVSGASGEDEDVIRFVGIFGSSTSGSFSLHFDGSDVSMTDKKEDIDALASDGTDLYFSVINNFSAGGVTADAEDVLTFSGTFGASTSGTFGIFWAGIAHGTTTSVVGFDLA